MSLWSKRLGFIVAAGIMGWAGAAAGNVFNMPAGLTSLEFVTVGNAGNAPDTRYGGAFGAVSYTYSIGRFEVTTAQYCEFLNAVARDDPYGLYSTAMANNAATGTIFTCNIQRSGAPGSYTYSVPADWANRPVGYISWGDVARFANWLSNGQPTGAQDADTTEDGSYLLTGAMTDAELLAVTRKAGARYVIPTEDEWYKTAYHDATAGVSAVYFDYPTGTNATPSNDLTTPDGGNSANFHVGPDGDPNGYTIGLPYGRTEVGDFEDSQSPYGTFDQGGNIIEWNETRVFSICRGLRGGGYYHDTSWIHANYQTGTYPSLSGGRLGFRVTELPEPGSAILLTLGALALKRRRAVG